MDDLLADFVAETREMLEALAGELVAWESDPADRARLDAIFRFFHTVKGNCGFFDFPRLEALSHAAEDALADVRAGRRQPDTALVDAALAIIDRIADMIDAIEAGEEMLAHDDEVLIAALAAEGEATDVAAIGEETAPEAATTTAKQSSRGSRSVRLPVDLLDRVMSGVSDMVLARNDLARRIHEMGAETGLEAPFNRMSAILAEVREAMTKTRMQRIDTLFTAFPRLIRDLSAELGKQVLVEIEGGDVELDREMIELVRDPMVHIIRNAVDHGIEVPEARREAGKHDAGLISISARQTGNEIRIGIVDDGKGLDTAKLVEKALSMGILTPERASTLTAREKNALICEAGFSTAAQVTSVSGRGVGMDVVRANLERMGGSIKIDSTLGAGTRIMLNVPLTLSIVPSLTIGVANQKFAIPRSYVEEIVRGGAEGAELARVGGRLFVTIRGKRVPCIALGDVLGIGGTAAKDARTLVVIRLVGGDRFGIAVDRIHDHEELVVKPIAPAIMKTGFYVGTTQLDDGSPVLMVDISGIAREAGLISEVEKVKAKVVDKDEAAEARPAIPALLFTGFDGRRRAVPMSAVDRVESVPVSAIDFAGEQVQVVIDGRILPLAGFARGDQAEGSINLLRLSDGRSEIAYAFGQMVDTAAIEGEITKAKGMPHVSGIALIDGEPADVIDCHSLFAAFGKVEAPVAPPVCRIPAGDRWFQDFLRPLVESAGYRVVDEQHEAAADIAIGELGGHEAGTLNAAREIWLRTTETPSAESAETIYRYDRDGLVAALKQAVGGARR